MVPADGTHSMQWFLQLLPLLAATVTHSASAGAPLAAPAVYVHRKGRRQSYAVASAACPARRRQLRYTFLGHPPTSVPYSYTTLIPPVTLWLFDVNSRTYVSPEPSMRMRLGPVAPVCSPTSLSSTSATPGSSEGTRWDQIPSWTW